MRGASIATRRALTPALSQREREHGRRGVASLDYILVLGIVLPLTTFLMWAGPRMMRLVYEMYCVLISWPFM